MFIVEIKFCGYYANVHVPGAKLLENFAMVFQPLFFPHCTNLGSG